MTDSSQTIHGDKVAGNKNIFNFFSGDSKARRAWRNRQNMLQLVWNTWIEGVLQQPNLFRKSFEKSRLNMF